MRRKFSTAEAEVLWDLYKESGSRSVAVNEALGLSLFQGRCKRTLERKIDDMRRAEASGAKAKQDWSQSEIDELMQAYYEVGSQSKAARIFAEKNPHRSISAASVRVCVECKKEAARENPQNQWRETDVGIHNIEMSKRIFRELDQVEANRTAR